MFRWRNSKLYSCIADLSRLDKSSLPGPRFSIKTKVTAIHDIFWDMENKAVEIRQFSGYRITEKVDGQRKGSSLTSKEVGNIDVSVWRKQIGTRQFFIADMSATVLCAPIGCHSSLSFEVILL